MAFGGRKGELLVVIGCGKNHLDSAKQVLNVTRIWDKKTCCANYHVAVAAFVCVFFCVMNKFLI